MCHSSVTRETSSLRIGRRQKMNSDDCLFLCLERVAPLRRLTAVATALTFALSIVPAHAEDVRVLIVGGQNNHDWKRSTPYLHWIVDQHPEISATIHNAPSVGDPDAWAKWNPDFAAYDVVLLDYNGQMWPGAVKERFDRYIRGGGTAMLIHAANNSFTGWTEYEQMVGLLWRGRDYGSSIYLNDDGSRVRVAPGEGRGMGHGGIFDWVMTTRDSEHPIATGMPLNWMHARDELYHGQRGPAENINVLFSAFSDPKHGGTGKHEPIVWWVPHGKGKVLTNVMGHVGEIECLQCVGFQTITRRGCLWLAGRPVDSTIPQNFPDSQSTSVVEMSDELAHELEKSRIHQVSELVKPRTGGTSGLAAGLSYALYKGSWDRLPQFGKLPQTATGVASKISARTSDELKDHYGLVFRGFIAIDRPGDYTFYTRSDDGSALLIDGVTVVNNDGVHGNHEEGGRVRLQAGVYPLEVRFFEKDGG